MTGHAMRDRAAKRRVLPKVERERAIILDGIHEREPKYHRLGDGEFSRDLHRMQWYTACGASIGFFGCWLNRFKARQIAVPCKRCYPDG